MDKINIQLLENGDHFANGTCGIDYCYKEISEDEYNRVTSFENYRGKLNAEYEETMSDAIRYGYGFYGCDVCKSGDKYYFFTKIGSSCD